MRHNNRVCICCGKEFYYCPRCGKNEKNTGISMNYDTNECAELANAISGYSMKLWGKEKIKEILDKYNVTDYTKYKQSVRDKLNELFPAIKEEIPMNPPIEIKEIQDTKKATTEQKENEIPEEVKPQRKRKSRKKKVVLSDETEKREQSDDGDNLEK